MAKRVVMLIADPNCGQAQLVANAIVRGYNDVAASAYCYRNGTIYNYTVNGQAFNVTNQGQIQQQQPHQTWDTVCEMLHLGQGNQGMDQPIGQPQFNALGKLIRYADSMTTFDEERLPQELRLRVMNELLAIKARFGGDELCFIIAPNPRNVPVRLQTFGHKLFWQNGVRYRKKSGGDYQINHLVETKMDAAAAVTELTFCREIVRTQTRYLGNCYGAQIMWLSLGGGVTSFKRNQGLTHNQTMVPQVGNNQPILNVNWNNGITMGGRINGDANNRAPVLSNGQRNNNQHVTYNSDFYHSCMMIESAKVRKIVEGDMQGIDRVEDHELADIISGDNTMNNPDDFLRRLQEYAKQDRFDRQNAPQGPSKQKRTWRWVGEYKFFDHVSGFQGHPLLFLHLNLPNRQNTLNLLRDRMFG